MYDLTPREWAAIVPLLALMVWMGCYSQTFMPAISSQNAQILEQTKTLKVERVEQRPEDRGQRPVAEVRDAR
jgi:NADH-quinone oxidoreductase subunit M